jgi:hypothetical protein
VEIDGDKATITFKGRVAPGKYAAMDSWSYSTKPEQALRQLSG